MAIVETKRRPAGRQNEHDFPSAGATSLVSIELPFERFIILKNKRLLISVKKEIFEELKKELGK